MSNLTTLAGSAGTAGQFPATNKHLTRWFIDNLKIEQLFEEDAKQVPIPHRSSRVVQFKKLTRFTSADQPLVEGVTPNAFQPTITKTTATLSQYGSYILRTDQFDDSGEDADSQDFAKEQAYQAGLTRDTVMRDAALGGTNVSYSNGSARTDVDTPIHRAMLTKTKRYLSRNSVRRFTTKTLGSLKVGTSILPASYKAFVHSDAVPDLEEIKGWKSVERYAAYTEVMKGEIGSVCGIRFCESANMSSNDLGSGTALVGASVTNSGMISEGASTVDVYQSIVFGQGFLACTKLDATSSGIILKPKGSAGSDDPLNQRGSQGWIMSMAGARLNETTGVRLEHGCSELE